MNRRLFSYWFTGFVLSAQLLCTALDINYFPFCSYNMFNRIPSNDLWQFQLELFDDVTGTSRTAHVGHLMPTEFFKAGLILSRLTMDRKVSENVKSEVLAKVFHRARAGTWHAFDEVYAPLRWLDSESLTINLVRLTASPGHRMTESKRIRLVYEASRSHK